MRYKDHLGNTFDTLVEMAKYHNIDIGLLRSRLAHNWDIEKALTQPVGNRNTKKNKVEDHLGNSFESITSMCKYWRINRTTYNERIKLGWDVGRALSLIHPNNNKEIIDPNGKIHKNAIDMCTSWNINYSDYIDRINQGWTVYDALMPDEKSNRITKNMLGIKVEDHLGNKFISIQQMCNHWNIDYLAFRARLDRGYSIEEGLTTEIKMMHHISTDHLGNTFNSIADMCRYWNIQVPTYRHRIKKGYTIEEALTIPKNSKKITYDHLGNKYGSIKAMCKHYNIDISTFKSRISSGWSLEDALTLKRYQRS